MSRLEVRPLRLGFRNLIFASGNRGRPSHRLEAGLTIKQNRLGLLGIVVRKVLAVGGGGGNRTRE